LISYRALTLFLTLRTLRWAFISALLVLKKLGPQHVKYKISKLKYIQALKGLFPEIHMHAWSLGSFLFIRVPFEMCVLFKNNFSPHLKKQTKVFIHFFWNSIFD